MTSNIMQSPGRAGHILTNELCFYVNLMVMADVLISASILIMNARKNGASLSEHRHS
ncbi:hypothetical protein LguiB_004224 [Lonicera macranthoides]